MRVFREESPRFWQTIKELSQRGEVDLAKVEDQVRSILCDVRERGDQAVLDACERFEHRNVFSLYRPMTRSWGESALASLTKEQQQALIQAKERIEAFHRHQLDAGFRYADQGVSLGTRVRPMKRAGVYAPGGKARYPSSVLMAAVPAKVAGVSEVFVATPLANAESDNATVAAAFLAGADAMIDAGGAQAIGALAYGTAQIPRVDIVVGPGNIYVACAKRLVSGSVRIDGIAGPSEILIVSDRSADPAVIAADLLSQAEHDEAAYVWLVTDCPSLADDVLSAMHEQLCSLPRQAIAQASVDAHGVIFIVNSRESMLRVTNEIAAEHLSVQLEDAESFVADVDHAGAIFIGHATPEAAGDYLAGPSHVLPTGGAVRFGAPLGVYDFLTRSSLIRYDLPSLQAQSHDIVNFARLEGLEAHARAVEIRLRRRSF